jgi:hypothetical protein
VIVIFLFDLVVEAAEFYVFKYLNTAGIVSEGGYLIAVWSLVVLGLGVVVIVTGQLAAALQAAKQRAYMTGVGTSKAVDAVGSFLWLTALAASTPAYIAAVGALAPLALLIVAYIAERVAGIDIRENTSRKHMAWKLVAVLLICVGGWLAR